MPLGYISRDLLALVFLLIKLEWYVKVVLAGMRQMFDYSERISLIKMPEWYARRAGGSFGGAGWKSLNHLSILATDELRGGNKIMTSSCNKLFTVLEGHPVCWALQAR